MRATSLRYVLSGLGALVACLSGCAAFHPIKGIPANTLPEEYRVGGRSGLRTIDLSLLRQTPPAAHLIDSGDVLAIYIEGELGRDTDPPPVHFPLNNEGPATFGLPIPVREDGTISLPKVGSVPVRGLTLVQAEQQIRQAYSYPAQIILPHTRVQVTLQRPRHYRILVIRQDSQNQSLGGVAANGLNLGMIRKGSGKIVSLPAYQNDVLNALTATEGLPGADAENACYVIRRRGARQGGILDPNCPPGLGAIMGRSQKANSEKLTIRAQSPRELPGSLHASPLTNGQPADSFRSLHETPNLGNAKAPNPNVQNQPNLLPLDSNRRVDFANWSSDQAYASRSGLDPIQPQSGSGGVVQAGSWSFTGKPARYGAPFDQDDAGNGESIPGRSPVEVNNGTTPGSSQYNEAYGNNQPNFENNSYAAAAARFTGNESTAGMQGQYDSTYESAAQLRANQLSETGAWTPSRSVNSVRSADYGQHDGNVTTNYPGRQIVMSQFPSNGTGNQQPVYNGSGAQRFSLRPQFDDQRPSESLPSSGGIQAEVVPPRTMSTQPLQQQPGLMREPVSPLPSQPGLPSLGGSAIPYGANTNRVAPVPYGASGPIGPQGLAPGAAETSGHGAIQQTPTGGGWNGLPPMSPTGMPVEPMDRGHSEWGPFGLDGRHVVRIPLRLGPGETVDVNERDVILEDGDIVFIESRDTEVFFTGGLLGGGQYTLPRDYDLDILQALSIASSRGGAGGGSARSIGGVSALNNDVTISPSTVIVLRKLPDGSEVPIKIDLYRARTDQNERVIIQPGDYILLQYTPIEAFAAFIERHLLEGALFTLASQNFNQGGN